MSVDAVESNISAFTFLVTLSDGSRKLCVTDDSTGLDLLSDNVVEIKKTAYVFTEVAKLKRCWQCKELKPATEFKTDRRNKDGKEGKCKECK